MVENKEPKVKVIPLPKDNIRRESNDQLFRFNLNPRSQRTLEPKSALTKDDNHLKELEFYSEFEP